MGFLEISQILMVSYDDYWVFSASEIVAPLLQGSDDRMKFPVIDIIILLGQREGFQVVSTGVKVSIGVLLHEHSPGHSEGGVGHDKELFGSIQHFEYWS